MATRSRPDRRRHCTNWESTARKHRAALAVVAAFAALLVVATVVSTALAISASRARDLARTALAASERARTEAQTINNFLVSSFGKPDPELDGAKVLVVDLLDGAAADLDLAYPGSPVVKGTLLTTLSHTYYGLGQYAKSEALRLRARDVFESASARATPMCSRAARTLPRLTSPWERRPRRLRFTRRLARSRSRR